MNQTKFIGWVIVNSEGKPLPWYADTTRIGCIASFNRNWIWSQFYRKGFRCKKFTAEVVS